MELMLKPGQTLRINIEIIDSEKKNKPGPKALVKGDGKSIDYHAPILKILADGPQSSEGIRQRLGNPEDVNTVSWALVELQNDGQRRGRGIPKTGPIVKENNLYCLR